MSFLSSSNFWTALVLLVGGLFVGFPEDVGSVLVSQFFALLASGKLLHEFFKNRPRIKIGAAVNRSNWWNYLGVVLVSVIPELPIDFVVHVEQAARAAIGGNWQGVMIASLSIVTIIINLLRSKRDGNVVAIR